jgi:hypothetical protein
VGIVCAPTDVAAVRAAVGPDVASSPRGSARRRRPPTTRRASPRPRRRWRRRRPPRRRPSHHRRADPVAAARAIASWRPGPDGRGCPMHRPRRPRIHARAPDRQFTLRSGPRAPSTSTSTASRPTRCCCARSPRPRAARAPTARRRSPASSSAGCRSRPSCRRSPACRRCSSARRPRPTAPAKLAEGGVTSTGRPGVVEDVVTSGGQVVTSCGQLRDLGAVIVGVLCVIDREAGGRERLAEQGSSCGAVHRSRARGCRLGRALTDRRPDGPTIALTVRVRSR